MVLLVRASEKKRTVDGDIPAAFQEPAYDIPAMASRLAPRLDTFQDNGNSLTDTNAHGA
jgi:hypothetical protein